MLEAPSPDYADACSKHCRLQARWENMFEKLKDYKRKYGNCLVPNRYKKDRSLGSWVSTQRRYFKLMSSSKCIKERQNPHWNEDQMARLGNIGFEWVATDPRHTPWETRFRELCMYKEQFGNVLVPIGYKENIKLANWVSTQRQAYKAFIEGRATSITPLRIYQLESIGMVWDAQKTGNCKRRHCNASKVGDIKNKETSELAETPVLKKCIDISHYQSRKDFGIMNIQGSVENKITLSLKHSREKMGAMNMKFSLGPQSQRWHDSDGGNASDLNLPLISFNNESTSKNISWDHPGIKYGQLHKMSKTVKCNTLIPSESQKLGTARFNDTTNYSLSGQGALHTCHYNKKSIAYINQFHSNAQMEAFPIMTLDSENKSSTPKPSDTLLAEVLVAGCALTTHMAVESVDQVHLFLETMRWKNAMNTLWALSNENIF